MRAVIGGDCVLELDDGSAARCGSGTARAEHPQPHGVDPRAAYLARLAACPDDKPALFGLGALLRRTGYRQAALTTYRRLAHCHPDDPAALVCLADALHQAGEPESALLEYQAALRACPGFAEAHQGIGNVLGEQGHDVAARAHWAAGYRDRVFSAWPFHGAGQPIRVLVPFSVAGGNVRARDLLDDTVCAVTAVAIEFWTPAHPLPPHDLVLNAVSDADLCEDALRRARALARATRAPVLNHPDAVARTGRADNAGRLRTLAGVVAPRMAVLRRAVLEGVNGPAALADAGFGFPVLLRAPGFHTGQHFTHVADAPALAHAAASLPGDGVLAIEYLDSRGTDGFARKGRVMIIDGALYPLHWAISPEWKVHYFTACMADHASHRAEEARFLSDMPGFLGPGAMAGLRAVADMLRLDYAGVDFALDGAGCLQVFEANAAMVIVPPPPGDMWEYRRGAAEAASAAFMRMVEGRSSFLKKRSKRLF